VAREVAHEVEAAEPAIASSAPSGAPRTAGLRASGASRTAALARALAGRLPVSNRGVGRVLARDTTDWPIINPWTGEPEDMSQFRTTDAPAVPAAGDAGAAAQSSTYGAVFRAEIIKWLEKFAPAPSLEGKGTGFDELLGAGGPEATRKTYWNYTTCNDTTIQIFAKAAQATNKQAGLTQKQVAALSTRKRIGIVNRASDFGAPEMAKAIAGAWVDASAGGHPEKADLLLMTGKKSATGYPEHIGFYYDYATSKSDSSTPPAEDADVWMTIDGGQGTKGTWTTRNDASSYVPGTGHESILKRERWHLPDGTIEGEPNQPGGYKKVLGWVKVDKLVDESLIPSG
jgi:hypothetical protein